jgi:hypothetical protein
MARGNGLDIRRSPRSMALGCGLVRRGMLGDRFRSAIGRCLLGLKHLFHQDHLQFVDLTEVRVSAVGALVEYLFAVNVDLQPPPGGWSQFNCNVARVVSPPEFRRQPRGDRVVASRDAIDDLDFHFAKFSTGHTQTPITSVSESPFECKQTTNRMQETNALKRALGRDHGMMAVPRPAAVMSRFWFSHTRSTDTSVPFSTGS